MLNSWGAMFRWATSLDENCLRVGSSTIFFVEISGGKISSILGFSFNCDLYLKTREIKIHIVNFVC